MSCRYLIFSVTALFLCEFLLFSISIFFFFNDTSPTEIYTLSLHDALPISRAAVCREAQFPVKNLVIGRGESCGDRKSTRLNSSHRCISYAVFCLKKKKKK